MRSFPWDSIIIGKNEEYGYPIIDRPSSAEDLRELYKTFFSNGVFLNDDDAFQVTPGDGMNVIVAGGKCGIEGTIGYEAAPRGLAIQASSSAADRIDTVVLRWNNNIEVRNIDLYVKTGVAQSVPVRPTLTRSESVWELGIADIFVAKNSGAISAARITDTRLQTDRCGAVTPFVQIDTTTFFNQIQAAIDERTAELEEQTAKAVELAQSAIDGTTAGNLQSQIDANKEAIESNKATDDERWESLSRKYFAAQNRTMTITAPHDGIIEVEYWNDRQWGYDGGTSTAEIQPVSGLDTLANIKGEITGGNQVGRTLYAKRIFSGAKSGVEYTFVAKRANTGTDGTEQMLVTCWGS